MAHLPIPATDSPCGFMPFDAPMSISPYVTDSSVAAIYRGDLVIAEADGALAVATTNSTAIVGAAAQYGVVSTANNNFLVYDNVLQKFWAQDDADTAAMAATSVGANCLIVATTGSTSLLTSAHEIDSNSAATTAANPIKIVALHPCEGFSYATSAAAGQQRKWVCVINNHFNAPYQQVGI